MEAKVVRFMLELVCFTLASTWVNSFGGCNILIFEYFSWLIVILLSLVLNVYPPYTHTNIWGHIRYGPVYPPYYSLKVLFVFLNYLDVDWIVLSTDLIVFASKTDKFTSSHILLIVGLINVTEIELHSESH